MDDLCFQSSIRSTFESSSNEFLTPDPKRVVVFFGQPKIESSRTFSILDKCTLVHARRTVPLVTRYLVIVACFVHVHSTDAWSPVSWKVHASSFPDLKRRRILPKHFEGEIFAVSYAKRERRRETPKIRLPPCTEPSPSLPRSTTLFVQLHRSWASLSDEFA